MGAMCEHSQHSQWTALFFLMELFFYGTLIGRVPFSIKWNVKKNGALNGTRKLNGKLFFF